MVTWTCSDVAVWSSALQIRPRSLGGVGSGAVVDTVEVEDVEMIWWSAIAEPRI